jgi:metal-responsive CopG/Arc/MetJ family transcriptional regulator
MKPRRDRKVRISLMVHPMLLTEVDVAAAERFKNRKQPRSAWIALALRYALDGESATSRAARTCEGLAKALPEGDPAKVHLRRAARRIRRMS